MVHDELGGQSGFFLVLFGGVLKEFDELLSIFVGDQHGGDGDAHACGVVAHDYVRDVLGVLIVDDYSEGTPGVQDVPGLLDKGAAAPVDKENGGQNIIRIVRKVLGELFPVAAVRVIRVVVDTSDDALTIGNVAKVAVGGWDHGVGRRELVLQFRGAVDHESGGGQTEEEGHSENNGVFHDVLI
jgi:hypothetical protein